jgi:metal-dependent HD superfamily phosphatase/phosphodiesterase
LRHTEIVYHSAAEIRQALAERGVPPALLDHTPNGDDEDEDDDAATDRGTG